MFKPTSEKDNIMRIGSYNVFGIKSYVLNTQIGDGNVIEARAEIKDGIIGNFNIIGSDTKISKKNIGTHFRIFSPGIMKEIDVVDEDRTKENLR
jgi:NDP-sugar pyrophosphorylase family protein